MKSGQFLPQFVVPARCSGAPARRTMAEMLSEDFERRRRSNPRYSLRAFALQLRIDSATLSQIMRGRRRLSARATGALCLRVGLPQPQREMLTCEALRDRHARRILRQLRRADFVAGSRALARRLRLRVDDVNAALARLVRDRRLRMASTTRWSVVEESQT